LLIVALVLASCAAPAGAQSERERTIEMFAEMDKSVGALYALSDGGDMSFLCSATAVGHEGDSVIILTAYHCVKKGKSYLINFGDNRFHPLEVWMLPHYEVDRTDVRKYGEPKTDMALFLLHGVDVPIVPMAENFAAIRGAAVVMVGFPLGLSKIGYEGSVAGTFDRPGSDDAGYILLQIFGAPGSSGSAVVSLRTGEVIGVLVAGRSSRGSGLPVIFATPIDYRRYLIPVAGDDSEGDE